MTGYEYRKKLEAQERRFNAVQKLMTQYHLNLQDAYRFYWERIEKTDEDGNIFLQAKRDKEIYEEGCTESEAASKKKIKNINN